MAITWSRLECTAEEYISLRNKKDKADVWQDCYNDMIAIVNNCKYCATPHASWDLGSDVLICSAGDTGTTTAKLGGSWGIGCTIWTAVSVTDWKGTEPVLASEYFDLVVPASPD